MSVTAVDHRGARCRRPCGFAHRRAGGTEWHRLASATNRFVACAPMPLDPPHSRAHRCRPGDASRRWLDDGLEPVDTHVRRHRAGRHRCRPHGLCPIPMPCEWSACCRGGTGTRPASSPSTSGLSPQETGYMTDGRQQPADAREPLGRRDPARRPRPRHPDRRRVVADPHASPQAVHATLPWPTVPEEVEPRPRDRRGLDDEPPRRGRPGDRHAGAGVPDVRDARSEPQPAKRSRSTRSGSASCGRGSPQSPPANPYAWMRDAKSAERDPHAGAGQPHDRAALSEVHELEQRRRSGCGAHHLLGRASASARCAGGSMGLRPRRLRLPRAHVHLRAVDVRRDAGDRARRPGGAGARRRLDRRHRPRRPLLLLSRLPCNSARSRSGYRSIVNSPAPAD